MEGNHGRLDLTSPVNRHVLGGWAHYDFEAIEIHCESAWKEGEGTKGVGVAEN